ncbi:SLC13 family permease [Desulfonema magnum]|uniref:Divalent anion:Na+ symporter family protein n=1 Tax=Desulfonema magnum TaxID=45655 RepID=A0A975BJ16_9BACT|nr:SLC13 family permease [Desulfonema magnum]QTA86253.1 Divalent anion:Na+ symporter family protein [Desulfonema magnum]
MHEEKSGQGKSFSQKAGLCLGLLLFFVMLLFDLDPGKPIVTRMAAVATLMAVWWITDAIPLFATALLPMLLYPLLGILNGKSTAPIYINSTIFLFMGGFMIALTMEKWNLHKRIALFIIRLIGGGPSRIVLGFMVAAAFLSMWISNTATAIMMVPIGMAIISQMEAKFSAEETHKFTVGLMLGIAYACSLGGVATLVGTPPNLSFARIFEITFPEAQPIAFGTWFIMGLPLCAVMLGIVWVMLTKIFFRVPAHITVDKSIVDKEYDDLGSMSFEEKSVLIIFFLTAFLWVFRKKLNLGFFSIPGWSELMPYPRLIDDGTVALFMAMILFLIPTRSRDAESPTVMGPDVIRNLPWNIVLLFGGGFALAKGFQVTGLSTLIGNKFSGLAGMSPILMILILCFSLTFLTELTSNTATTEMILPILASVAFAMKTNPLMLMIPATLSASCAFMMPVATPPNAIVFGSGRIKIAEMAKVGIFINIIGVFVITALFYIIGTAIFSIDPNIFPEWAKHMGTGAH